MDKDSTKERSGVEYTSVTGTPGMPGGPYAPGHSDGCSNQDQSFEEIAKEEAFKAFFGATGGVGGIPENIQDATKEGTTTNDMMVVFEAEIKKEMDLDSLVKKTKEAHNQFVNVETKANIACASRAYIAGKWLERTRKVYCLESKGWIKYANKTFPEISKSSRENYINVAFVPSAQKHFALGVERLAEFGSYLNSLSFDQKKNLGDDPITRLAEGKVDLDVPIAQNMAAINALSVNYKLEKRGILVTWDVLLMFYECGLTISSDDTKHLISLVDADKENTTAIDAYLQALIDNNGDREALLGEIKPDAKQLNTRIKNIDRQVIQLTEAITKILEDSEVKGGVDTSILDNLINTLSSLKKKLS